VGQLGTENIIQIICIELIVEVPESVTSSEGFELFLDDSVEELTQFTKDGGLSGWVRFQDSTNPWIAVGWVGGSVSIDELLWVSSEVKVRPCRLQSVQLSGSGKVWQSDVSGTTHIDGQQIHSKLTLCSEEVFLQVIHDVDFR